MKIHLKPFIAAGLFLLFATEGYQVSAAAPTYRVYATREGLVGGTTANGYVIKPRDHFCALPSRTALNVKGGYTYTVNLYNPANGRRKNGVPVWDVGPWNTKDNYWHVPRESWSSLPRGKPEAQAAYQDGFNGGKDEFGRVVQNPAGIDLADGTFWDDLGMVENGWIDVTYNWETGNSPAAGYVPGDFVEDGKTDCSLWNPSNGQWNIRSSVNAAVYTFSYGQSGDIPLIGHISSASRAEAGIFRPSTSTWFWRHGVTGATIGSYVWGQNGDIPLVGAWSGRMWDAVAFRPSTGRWYIRLGDTGNSANFIWGQNGDIPMVGDVMGNGMVDQAVFRPSTGTWYWRNGVTGQTIGSYAWGQSGDIPMVGAWSGRMRDAAIFRPSTGMWYIRFGDTGDNAQIQFGQAGDTPMVGNFFGNGVKDQVVYRRSTGQWWVRNGVTGAVSNFVFGSNSHMAVSE